MTMATPSPDAIRAYLNDNPNTRARDAAASLKTGEAALLAAQGAMPISTHLDTVMPALNTVGSVMALTRNESAVHEKDGIYENYRGGPHASMVINDDIDLRMFPKHWVHGFAQIKETERGTQRSMQFFDAAGDAVHKVFAREDTDIAAWDDMVKTLSLDEQITNLTLAPRAPADGPKADPAKAEELRKAWTAMTDTHQFMRLTSHLNMNRLGAYRIAGKPFVKPLAPWALNDAIVSLGEADTEIMLFVGNPGCIQIHTGPLNTIKPMGPWQNVLDPKFNLHLRKDHVTEVWAVEKPTKRGMAVSIEAFDKHGTLILQMFGRRREADTVDHTGAFKQLISELPQLHLEDA
ncbi:hemin-degrading factor [Octadecabacter ascidiaceicola]|uniref:Hemin transport protein HemS n=1 Tax=Octadecabacter ascidiaceicola TaxID=1655543 RepID=A0A238JLR0_9RHOB|nr:ChuX/HutX family heme-like substrate-binding protein [Octadecabacter ascidiaceicola]SMX30852.1 Hemin transport protein HemS [Octadecabacter ascidiaceicola]